LELNTTIEFRAAFCHLLPRLKPDRMTRLLALPELFTALVLQ